MKHIFILQSFRVVSLAIAWGTLAAFGGCGIGGPDKIAVSGNVTFQGQSVPGGTIYFVPCDGTEGLPANASIKDGRYHMKTNGGLSSGDYNVKIEAYRHVGVPLQAVLGTGPEQQMQSREQYIPAKYNTNTELKLTVESGSGTIKQDFDLSD